MPRGLDHVVHCVRDLDAAAATYRALGFQVGGENFHPWGTKNRLVQTPGFFIEVLTIADASKFAPPAPRRVSFGRAVEDWMARNGEGGSHLVLESQGAEADAEAFRAAGIGDFEPFHFARAGKRPDGSVVEVAFTIAYATPPLAEPPPVALRATPSPASGGGMGGGAQSPQPGEPPPVALRATASPANGGGMGGGADSAAGRGTGGAPDAGFFVCQQHHPENFWNPAYQVHPNGVSAVRGVVLTADDPARYRAFFEAFAGVPARAAADGLVLDTPRGAIEVLTPAACRGRVGVDAPGPGLRIAALRFATTGPLPAPALAHGLGLVFEHP